MAVSEKLMRIQTEIKAPKNLYNSFGKYKYRNAEGICEAVKPFLAKEKCSLTLSDSICEVGGRVYVKAHAVLEDCESGAIIGESEAYAREAESKKGMDESQVTGTASSYARKYALNGLFLLDDTKDADTDEFQAQNSEELDREYDEEFDKAIEEQKALGKQKISETKVKALKSRCEKEKVPVDKILNLYKVPDFTKLSENQCANIHNNWEKIKTM